MRPLVQKRPIHIKYAEHRISKCSKLNFNFSFFQCQLSARAPFNALLGVNFNLSGVALENGNLERENPGPAKSFK